MNKPLWILLIAMVIVPLSISEGQDPINIFDDGPDPVEQAIIVDDGTPI